MFSQIANESTFFCYSYWQAQRKYSNISNAKHIKIVNKILFGPHKQWAQNNKPYSASIVVSSAKVQALIKG
jgi:hypothetical protein